jgi:hypothetical protein
MLKNMQGRLKESSRGIGLFAIKLFSGFLLGLTIALIVRQITNMGNFSFIFVIVCMIGVFVRLSQKWKFTGVLLFNLFCVMTAMLLRMYILIAPGQ